MCLSWWDIKKGGCFLLALRLFIPIIIIPIVANARAIIENKMAMTKHQLKKLSPTVFVAVDYFWTIISVMDISKRSFSFNKEQTFSKLFLKLT